MLVLPKTSPLKSCPDGRRTMVPAWSGLDDNAGKEYYERNETEKGAPPLLKNPGSGRQHLGTTDPSPSTARCYTSME